MLPAHDGKYAASHHLYISQRLITREAEGRTIYRILVQCMF